MESCMASICCSSRGESFTCTGPEPPAITWLAPTPAGETADGGGHQQRRPPCRCRLGRAGRKSLGQRPSTAEASRKTREWPGQPFRPMIATYPPQAFGGTECRPRLLLGTCFPGSVPGRGLPPQPNFSYPENRL